MPRNVGAVPSGYVNVKFSTVIIWVAHVVTTVDAANYQEYFDIVRQFANLT